VLEEGVLRIESLEVDGAAMMTARHFFHEGRDLELVVRQMLDVGGTILQHGAHQATLQSVSAEVDRLVSAIGDVAADQFPVLLARHSNDLQAILARHFDPSQVGSVQEQFVNIVRKLAAEHQHQLAQTLLQEEGPLGVLRAELGAKIGALIARHDSLTEQLTDVREKLAAAKATATERERSTAKGSDFESAVAAAVEYVHAPYEDLVVEVANTIGARGGKTGDISVHVNREAARGKDIRIVVEAKCRALSLPAALKELDAAMENREAQAGVLVFRSVQNAPLAGRCFRVFPGNRLMVVFDEDQGEFALEVACNVARMCALRTAHEQPVRYHAERVSTCVRKLAAILDDAKAIARGTNAARKGLDQIDTGYSTLRSNASAVLEELSSALRPPVTTG
jgi:hypothetical protein